MKDKRKILTQSEFNERLTSENPKTRKKALKYINKLCKKSDVFISKKEAQEMMQIFST